MALSLKDGTIYILDINKLRISKGLKWILETDSIEKLMFNCRPSVDCLLYEHHVKLSGIIDIQLIQNVLDIKENQVATVELSSFTSVVEKRLSKASAQTIRDLEITDKNLWLENPINEQVTEFLTKEIRLYFMLYDSIPIVVENIVLLSSNYANRQYELSELDKQELQCKEKEIPEEKVNVASHQPKNTVSNGSVSLMSFLPRE